MSSRPSFQNSRPSLQRGNGSNRSSFDGKNPHLWAVEECVSQYNTDLKQGLSDDEVKERIRIYGLNEFAKAQGKTWYGILAQQTFTFMNFVLLIAMVLSFVVLSWIDAGVVAAIILINSLLGFTQEWKSEKTMASLRSMATPTCLVIRNGKETSIESNQLVQGDIVVLEQGNSVPADCRVFETINLETDEAMLTGESIPVKKITTKLVADNGDEIGVGDRKNMIYMSTGITKGKGKAIVTSTGNQTQIGRIAKKLMRSTKSKTPLQIRLDRLGFILCGVAIVCIAIVLLTGWGWGTFSVYPEGLRVAVSAAVAVIPQSIVVVVTLILTVGVKEMAKNKALVRNLNAVETLGNIMHICSDKTGTLTQGKMMATGLRLYNGSKFKVSGLGIKPEGEIKDESDQVINPKEHEILKRAITIASLCNMAFITKEKDEQLPNEQEEQTQKNEEVQKEQKDGWVGSGSPTEIALIVLGHKAGLSKDDQKEAFTLTNEYPFDSTIKMMSTVYKDNNSGQHIMFTKGAPERLVALCSNALADDMNPTPLSNEDREKIKVMNREMASEGLRVLALCYKELGNEEGSEDRSQMEKDITFVGLVGVKDPPRDGVPESIKMCHRAGIAVHMVTGDHQFTARAIAKQIGILSSELTDEEADSLVMTATEFDKLTTEQLQNKKSLPLVIARCSPDSKVRMVQELQRRGRRVAMLGDGVNDSPAIKLADVGVSMGLNGSDVTKEASDIVLMDDNFNTIVAAVKEGRRIFANIRRSQIHLLCGNFAEAIIVVLGVAFSLNPPLTPMQILWINLFTSAPPAFVLGTTPAKQWYMWKEKRPVDEAFFNWETLLDIFFWGPLIGGLSIVNFVIARFAFDQEVRRAQAACFTALTMMLMHHAYNCRDLRGPFWKKGFLKFYWLHVTTFLGVATLFFTFYVPPFEVHVFEHRRPDWKNWVVAIGTTVLFVFISEIYKLIKRPFRKRSTGKKMNRRIEEDEYRIYNTIDEERRRVSSEMRPIDRDRIKATETK